MSVLVTGAAGFVGSHVVDALLDSGERVVGFDSLDDFYDPRQKEANLESAGRRDGFSLVRGDIRVAGDLDGLPDDIDAVVHMAARPAGRPSLSAPALYADINVVGTARMLEWVASRGIRTVVFASSSSVYGRGSDLPFSESGRLGDPVSPYGASKRAGELFCRALSSSNAVDVACLRFFTVYGPRQRPDLAVHKFARLIEAGSPIPVYGDGTSARDYTYVADIVGGVVAALAWARRGEGRYRVFNLGSDTPVELTGMIEVLADAMDAEPVLDFRDPHPGDLPRTWARVDRARAELGYEPKTSFPDGIRAFVEWFRCGAGVAR